jgi:DNA-binding NarL/FixJ family response regulator
MRILCVDDHVVVLAGLVSIMRQAGDIEVVGCATSGEEALDLYRRHRPDVTLLDMRMPGMNGVQTIEAIRSEDPVARIVVLTVYQGEEDIFRALQAGASAYLLKDTLADHLIRVVREVHSGRHGSTASGTTHMNRLRQTHAMTAREVQVLEGVARGMRNKEIADWLCISELTVQAHMKSIFAKLEVHDRTAALSVAVRRGIVHLGD